MMAEVIRFETVNSLPDLVAVLGSQGVPADARLPDRVHALTARAFALFEALAEPIGIRSEISLDDFARIYPGEGLNAPYTPLEDVLDEANRLALFAVTVGAPVCDEISRLFDHNDPATGCMLDAVASGAAELLAAAMAADFEAAVSRSDPAGMAMRVLPYSPGYCGWHVSGQRRLFASLQPAQIGISLNDSCLMQPLKSVSGVLVAAPPEAHVIEPGYPFCADCATQSCRERADSILDNTNGGR